MGWKLGHILFAHNFSGKVHEFLDILNLQAHPQHPGTLDYPEIVHSGFEGTALGYYQNASILSDLHLSQQCIMAHPHLSELDRQLLTLSSHGDIMSLFLQESIGFYAWAYFQAGQKIRVYQELQGEKQIDVGDALVPEEDQTYTDQALFALTSRILGTPLNHLISDSQVRFKVLSQKN